MKSNRILYPDGKRISASAYAATRTQDQFHLVTAKGQEYFVHRYEGPLNKLKRAVVLLTYPKEKFGVCNTLKVFLCSDFSLADAEILEHYTHRWKIEVMFKQQKRYLGLKSFMNRTTIAIDSFLNILTVAWYFLTCTDGVPQPLCVGARRYRGVLTIL